MRPRDAPQAAGRAAIRGIWVMVTLALTTFAGAAAIALLLLWLVD